MKIKTVGGILLAVPAVILLAFGPSETATTPKGVVVVEYWEKWTGGEGAALKESVDEFNRTVGREKGIFVNVLSTSGIVQKTLVSTAGGVPPDLAGIWETMVPQLASLGVLEPLDRMAAEHGLAEGLYKKVFWDMCRYEDRLYALVSTPFCYAFYSNTEILRQKAEQLRAAGLDPDKLPTSIDEVDRFAQALDEVNADGSIRRTGYLPMDPGWDLNYVPYQFGGSWWDAKNKKFTFTDPKVVEAFQWVRGYSERLGKAAVSDFRSAQGNYDSPQNLFISGNTAMCSQGTFFANTIQVNNPAMSGKFRVSMLPVNAPDLRGTTSCATNVLVIPKGAKHKREAFEFVAWLNTQPAMERLCNAHCAISPLAKVSKDFLNHHKNPFIRVFEEMAQSPNAHGSPSIETMPDVGLELASFAGELVAMRVEAKAGLEEVQRRCQARYDDFMAKRALYQDQ